MDEKISQKIRELQELEQRSQQTLMQKQSFQIELNEISNALDELQKTGDEVYKILSGIMVKSEKQEILKELEEKKKINDLKINSISKQEIQVNDKIEKLREEITKWMKN